MYFKYFIAALFTLLFSPNAFSIINGELVDIERHREVIKVFVPPFSYATATLVGPRVLVTSAHNAKHEQVVSVRIKGKAYLGTFLKNISQPPRYYGVAIIVLERNVPDVPPAQLAPTPKNPGDLLILGYGCNSSDFTGAGQLRSAVVKASEITDDDLGVYSPEKDVSLCAGDGGGPAYRLNRGHQLVGIGSYGNYIDQSSFTRIDSADNMKFLKDSVQELNLEICGINIECNQ